MPANLTTTSQVDPAVATFYDKVTLKRALPYIMFDKFAQRRPLPKNQGNTVKWRRYLAMAAATVPLTEGVTPPGQLLTKTDLTAQIQFFGDYLHISDVVDLTNQDAVLTEAAEVLGEQSGITLDLLMRDILCACASQVACTGGANSQTPTNPLDADITAITKALRAGNARFITQVQVAGTGVGTSPVRPAFWAIAHSDLDDAWEACVAFKSTAEYATQKDVMDGEWGTVKNLRILSTTNGQKTTATHSTYLTPVIGKDAYGITQIDGHALQNIVKGFGSGGTADPLNQRCTSGWKATFAGRILNDAFMALLYSTNKAGGA